MFSGNQIEGSTVGIYGLGRIGTSVMEKLLPFHPNKIIYHDIMKKDGK
jgi:phosphoglycerate dehydrogenase-like enzyme